MGNMRLPTTGEGKAIDEGKAREIIEYAYEQGVNYFDTAFRYHSGESEKFVGKVLSQYKRDSFYLATKMPGHMMNYKDGKLGFQGYLAGEQVRSPADIFEEQLERCRVDYFDFYLLHNLAETSYDFYTNEEAGVVSYLLDQKKKGRIRHLGFSCHGSAETIEKFLNWKNCFEFAQIQLNYLDWTLQNAKGKYEVLTEHNIPVIVMEPCRGGKLANFDEKTNGILKQKRPDDSIASWAVRFAASLPNVQVVLSGMSTLEQLQDNLKTFSSPAPMTQAENELVQQVVTSLMNQIPCTACRYCCEECPQKLDIPRLISLFNEVSFEVAPGLDTRLAALKSEELPSNCIACGACKQICPQGIDIPAIMKKLEAAIAARKGK
jgi:predicted aldo/keto reductase-like oxidoreductase